MGILTEPIKKEVNRPLEGLRTYKDEQIPKYQGKANMGKMPERLQKEIEKFKKLKKLVEEKLPPIIRAVTLTIAAIETAKMIAEAAKDAGKIGSALVPPVAAAGVLQEKIVEKVKEEISDAKAALKNTDFIISQLKSMAIEVIIALLAIKVVAMKNGAKSGDSSDDSSSAQNDLDKFINENSGDDDGASGQGSGLTAITRTTTIEGTTQTGGGGGGGGTGGSGGSGGTGGGGGY